VSTEGLPTRGGEAASGWDAVIRPFLLIGSLAVALPVLATALAPASVAGPLALAGAVAPLVGGFLWRPKAALLAFAIYLLFADTAALYFPDAFSYIDEICVPCFVVIALMRWRPITRQRISPVRDGAVALFFAAAIASSLLHHVPLSIWLPEFGLVAKGIAFLYVVSWIDHRPEDIRAYGRVIFGLAVVVFAFAAVEWVAPSLIPRLWQNTGLPPREGLPSLRGPFVQPVHFSWFCAFIASLAFARFAVMRGWFALALGLAGSLGVILSARRWSLLSLVAAIAGGIVLTRAASHSWSEVMRAWVAAAAGTAILILAFLPAMLGLVGLAVTEYVAPAAQAGPSVGETDSGEALLPRIALYRGSFQIARDELPLGVGLGRYASWMSGVEYSPVYAQYGLDTVTGLTPDHHPYITDTFWPQIIGEAGALGLVAYLAFLGSIGFGLLRLIRAQFARAPADPVVLAFALAAGIVFGLSLAESIANTMFHHPPEAFITFGVFGVAASLLWQQARASQPTASARP
jgi:hypothetical protein